MSKATWPSSTSATVIVVPIPTHSGPRFERS